MMAEPIVRCIEHLKEQRTYDEIIYMTPDGDLLNQKIANEPSLRGNLAILCGHYKGIDQRIRDRWITREISIGDYVLSGGELGAAVLTDAIVRLLPGALNDETSALSDSFQTICWRHRFTPDPRTFAGCRCRKSCSAATSPASTNGGTSSLWSEPGNADPISSKGVKRSKKSISRLFKTNYSLYLPSGFGRTKP